MSSLHEQAHRRVAKRIDLPEHTDLIIDETLEAVRQVIRKLPTGEHGVRFKHVVDFKRELLVALGVEEEK